MSRLQALALCAGLAAFQAAPSPASAEESPQRFALELKFGPYYPDVDKEPGLTTNPYERTFGKKEPLLIMGEFDWQFARVPGVSFALGVMGGFFADTAKAIDPETGERSGEKTALYVLPGHLDLVIRIDALPRYTKVPLVPFAKVGLSCYMWWIKNGRGIARYEGDMGYGATFGWNLQVGLMLQLDFFEPGASRTFDQEVGVNHSYLYADFVLADIDGFGSDNELNLSEMTWSVGLAIEF